MTGLVPGSLILGYADELIAEFKAKAPGEFRFETLEERLAVTLEKIVSYIREGRDEILRA